MSFGIGSNNKFLEAVLNRVTVTFGAAFPPLKLSAFALISSKSDGKAPRKFIV